MLSAVPDFHDDDTVAPPRVNRGSLARQIPAEEKALTPPPSVFHTQIHPFKRSPIMLRPRKSRKARNSCGSADIIVHEDPQSPSGSAFLHRINVCPFLEYIK